MTDQTEQGALRGQRLNDAFDVARHALSHGYNDIKSVNIIMDVLRERIDAAVSTPEGYGSGDAGNPAAVPAGYALVPLEPTPAMLDAVLRLTAEMANTDDEPYHSEIWSAMVAAATAKDKP